jgi:hypothetical protein
MHGHSTAAAVVDTLCLISKSNIGLLLHRQGASCPLSAAAAALLFALQANTDYFGDQMKSAALQRARAIASGDAAAAAADSSDEDGEAAAEDAEMEAAEEAAAADPADADGAKAKETADKPAAAAEGEAAAAAAESKDDAPAGEAAAAAAAAEGEEKEGEEEEGEEEDDDGDGEDVGSEDAEEAAAAAREGQEEAPEVTGAQGGMKFLPEKRSLHRLFDMLLLWSCWQLCAWWLQAAAKNKGRGGAGTGWWSTRRALVYELLA